jgi:2-polyprenyl-3-methyl-5-hydroxy-6-metoxy-1,4-benzoquinol methylase
MKPGLDMEALTAVYKLLGDETRLRILALLGENELAVGEIQKILGLGQSTLSSQLSLIKEQELVASRKEGQKVYYRIADGSDSPKIPIVRGALEKVSAAKWHGRDQRLLQKILLEREEVSRAFFNRQAVQNMPAPGQTWQALALGLMHSQAGKRIVDLGCGNGRLARLFAEAGNHVTALDNSEEQIRLAKKTSHPVLKPGSLEFRMGSMEATGLPASAFDVVLLSQALHHAANPKEVIREAYRLAAAGGRILILDLLAHEEDWLRGKFGDFWLGFSEADLRAWLTEAGFRVTRFDITEPSPEYPDLEGVMVMGEKKK